MVNFSDCKARGRGTHTDSSANKAGLYAVRISLRTLSDVPAYGNGNQAKPQTWQAEGKFAGVLLPICYLEFVLSGQSGILILNKIFAGNVSGGVNLYSVCVHACDHDTSRSQQPAKSRWDLLGLTRTGCPGASGAPVTVTVSQGTSLHTHANAVMASSNPIFR